MPRKEQTPKKKTPKKKTKEKSPKRSEDPKMDEAEINRLLQNALDEANARAEQKLEERLTALREEINQKHQEEMIELQDARPLWNAGTGAKVYPLRLARGRGAGGAIHTCHPRVVCNRSFSW